MVLKQLDSYMKSRQLTFATKVNSKWIKDFNVKHKTIKLLEDDTGENLDVLRFGNDFLDVTPKA
jgi:hypothetical protein